MGEARASLHAFFGHLFSLFWPFFEVPFRSTILPEFSFMVWKNAVFFSGTSAAKLGDFQGHFCYHFLSFLALKKMSLFKGYHRVRKSYHRARAEKRGWDEARVLPSLIIQYIYFPELIHAYFRELIG